MFDEARLASPPTPARGPEQEDSYPQILKRKTLLASRISPIELPPKSTHMSESAGGNRMTTNWTRKPTTRRTAAPLPSASSTPSQVVNAQAPKPADSYHRPGADPLQAASERRRRRVQAARVESKRCSDGVREAALLWRFVAESAVGKNRCPGTFSQSNAAARHLYISTSERGRRSVCELRCAIL